MTAVKDIIASVGMALSEFFFDYGTIITAVVCILLAAGIFIMLYRAEKAGGGAKVRHTRYKFRAPDSLVSEAAAQSLAKAISIETVTGNAEQIEEFHRFLQQRYPLVFSKTEVDVINHGSLLIRWSGANSELPAALFTAHMDVVPAEGEWSCEPFEGIIKDDKVYGRGAVDCKNVLISLMESAEYLLKRDFCPDRDIYFAFGHDEEQGGEAGAAIIARLLKKRGVNIGMTLDEGGCIINGYMGSRNAAACVYVSEKCKCNIEITAHGKEGHASEPGKHTVIGILAEAVCRIEAAAEKKKMLPIACEYFKKSAGFMSFGKRFICANLPFTKPLAKAALASNPGCEAMMRTTSAATVISGGRIKNVLPARAAVSLDVRLLPGQSCKKLVEKYEKLLADLPCTVEVSFEGSPSEVSDYKSRAFKTLTDAVNDRFGRIPVIPAIMNGGSDSRYYESVCSCVYRFMPFVLTEEQLGAMHGNDENIPIQSLGAGVEFYIELMKRIGGTDGM